jgi:DNA recombination protein RmuC
METLLIILIVILIVLNIGMIFFLVKNRKEKTDNPTQTLKDEFNSFKQSFSQSFGNMSTNIAKDMAGALSRVDEKVGVFNTQVENLNKSQENFSRILAGVKQYGVLAEFSLASLLNDLLPASQYIANVKMKPDETGDTVEFAIKLQDVLVPIDSHWPIEKFKDIDSAYQAKDKEALAEARKDLAAAFRTKAKSVSTKYIAPPKTVDFAIVYAPTEGLFAELSSYRDPKTKQLLLEEVRTKYKITVAGPNTLSALLQSYHLGFQTLKVQKHATQIYNDLKLISVRFEKHFSGIIDLRKKLEQAMSTTDNFGRDARSIMGTLNSIKDPGTLTEAVQEDSEKIKVMKK